VALAASSASKAWRGNIMAKASMPSHAHARRGRMLLARGWRSYHAVKRLVVARHRRRALKYLPAHEK